MKKIIILLFTIGLTLSTCIPVQAYSTYVCTNQTSTHMPYVHTDSAHWDFRSGYWMCANEDYHQAYYDRWIETNGKWPYAY